MPTGGRLVGIHICACSLVTWTLRTLRRQEQLPRVQDVQKEALLMLCGQGGATWGESRVGDCGFEQYSGTALSFEHLGF